MTTTKAIQRRDRWADWVVVALVAVALLLGWVLKESVLSRTVPFNTGEAGISGRRPEGWITESGDDPLLRARDPRGGAFDTVLELRSQPLGEGAETGQALDDLRWERATRLTAYQTLGAREVLVGREALPQRTFTYVHEDTNPYTENLPVVVRGVDVALRDGDRAIVVTYLAGAEDFDADYRYFRAFLRSLEY